MAEKCYVRTNWKQLGVHDDASKLSLGGGLAAYLQINFAMKSDKG